MYKKSNQYLIHCHTAISVDLSNLKMSRSHGSTRKLGRDLDKFPESDEVGIWKSKRTISIPLIDVVTFAFTYAVKYDEEKPVGRHCNSNIMTDFHFQIWVDARDPSKVVTRKSAKIMVEKLIRGLKRIGVSGKCVCLHAYNNVSQVLNKSDKISCTTW